MRLTAVLSIASLTQSIALAYCGAAHAQHQAKTASFRVSTTVVAGCEVTAPDLSFDPATARPGAAVTGSTTVAIRCAPETAYTVGLNAGTARGAALNQRQSPVMNQPDYRLYQDAGRSRIWGNTIGSNTVPGEGTGQSVDHTIFGAVPARRVFPVGEYGDTVTVQVYF